MTQKLLPKHSLRERFDLYLNIAELAMIRENAYAANLPVSTYIRKLALLKPIKKTPSLITIETWRELSRIGKNINQISVFAAKGTTSANDYHTLEKILEEIENIRIRIQNISEKAL